jgi:hypothetical protein
MAKPDALSNLTDHILPYQVCRFFFRSLLAVFSWFIASNDSIPTHIFFLYIEYVIL